MEINLKDTVNVVEVNQETGELTIPQSVLQIIKANELTVKKAKAQNDQIKKALVASMEEYGIDKIESDLVNVTYVDSFERYSVDSKALQKKYPKIYDDVTKVTNVKASVRVTVKG